MHFLADDAELIRRQLQEGLDPELTPGLQALLRDQISTDEITPAYIRFFYDETLGGFPSTSEWTRRLSGRRRWRSRRRD